MEDVRQSPLSMTEIVAMQGGQVSNNALWDEQQQGQSTSTQGQSASTAAAAQPESSDSCCTQKETPFTESIQIQTLPDSSSSSSQPCACFKGRLSKTLNWSLAVRVCHYTDVACLPLASLSLQQPPTRSTPFPPFSSCLGLSCLSAIVAATACLGCYALRAVVPAPRLSQAQPRVVLLQGVVVYLRF
jgi:hypothetical protein